MSDLAPFVAAALRDKVFHELQEENAKLRKQLADNANEVARDALRGPMYCTAIVGMPDTAVVYAMKKRYQDPDTGVLRGDPFRTIRDCTVADLFNVQIFTNGVSSGPFRDLEILFVLNINDVDTFCADFSSLEDALDSVPWTESDNDYADFIIVGLHERVQIMRFDLPGVSKRQLLQFAGIDPSDFLVNPRPIHVGRNLIFIEHIREFFGEGTLVVFN